MILSVNVFGFVLPITGCLTKDRPDGRLGAYIYVAVIGSITSIYGGSKRNLYSLRLFGDIGTDMSIRNRLSLSVVLCS